MWKKNETVTIRLSSGLLVKDLPVFIDIETSSNFSIFPFSIVLTQACDIDSYYKIKDKLVIKADSDIIEIGRQIITQIILCPLFDEDQFSAGIHLKEQFKYVLPQIKNKSLENLKTNSERYHFIKSNYKSLPNFFVDFKHYYTLPINFLLTHIAKETKIYSLEHIYHTELADRFSHYLQRVAIPDRIEEE